MSPLSADLDAEQLPQLLGENVRVPNPSEHDNPEVLRCFMGYIIDLTLVLNELFLVVIAIRPPRALQDEDLELAFQNYKNSDLSLVHREIRQYVRDANWGKLLQSDAAELKYCSVVSWDSTTAQRVEFTQSSIQRAVGSAVCEQ
ncbi:hypothetical protein C8R45DRAFT_944187 [Mycena sanguinolenta]|nr:hypothetical protein C8R45DRAFT_944187 [Mycena sanguinolenta]